MFENMLRKLFNFAVMAIALGGSVWLVIGGSPLFIEILMLVNAGLLATIVFGFKAGESSGPDGLSIWAGPVPRSRAADR